jgi:hypothetical protein
VLRRLGYRALAEKLTAARAREFGCALIAAADELHRLIVR